VTTHPPPFPQESKRREVVESYVRGLCWVIQYYYQGCQSWKWFYEFHYSPFASDLVDLESIEKKWPVSRPFKPFEQLMAVRVAIFRALFHFDF
jgi:5'-3' exoribonuclease 2